MFVEHQGDLVNGLGSDVTDVGGSLSVGAVGQAIVLSRVRIPKVKCAVVLGAKHLDLHVHGGVSKVFTDVGVPKAFLAKITYCAKVGLVFQVDPNNARSSCHKFVALHHVNSKNVNDCPSDAFYEIGLGGEAQDGGVDGAK